MHNYVRGQKIFWAYVKQKKRVNTYIYMYVDRLCCASQCNKALATLLHQV